MKINYSAHDETYRWLKANGRSGWNTAEQLAATIRLLEKFFDSPEVPRSGRVLELGCGAGDLSLWLSQKGFEPFGVDISPTAIHWDHEKFAAQGLRDDFRVESVLELSDFEEDCFDIVLDGHCLHCIIGTDREIFLSKAYRVLRPGGILHIAMMTGDIHDPEIRAAFDPETRCVIRHGIAVRQIEQPAMILRD